jgi:hypothetical protein
VVRRLQAAGIEGRYIKLVRPGDPELGRKLEPENRAMAGTLWRSHAVLGPGGLLAGLALAWLLVTFAPPLTRSSPLFTDLGLGVAMASFGLLIAGLISLRPDHDRVIAKTRLAVAENHRAVVVHCADREEVSRVSTLLPNSTHSLQPEGSSRRASCCP